jgi:hypothetical protein
MTNADGFALTINEHQMSVVLAFKIVQRGKKELFINRLASWMTLSSKPSFENASHVEILIREEPATKGTSSPKWFRYSIMKQRGLLRRSLDEEGHNIDVVTWTPGEVHKIESGENMLDRNYAFFSIPASPSDVNEVKMFLESQVGSPFNRWGYLLNFVTPFRFGVSTTNPKKILKKENSWFCSELVTCALQSFQENKMNEIKKLVPCEQSPNDLYKLILRMFPETDQTFIVYDNK